jgi:hypothetical protein
MQHAPEDNDEDLDIYLRKLDTKPDEQKWILVSTGLSGPARLASVGQANGLTRVVYTAYSDSYIIVTDIAGGKVIGHRIIGDVSNPTANPPRIARATGDVVVAMDKGKIKKMVINKYPMIDELF